MISIVRYIRLRTGRGLKGLIFAWKTTFSLNQNRFSLNKLANPLAVKILEL